MTDERSASRFAKAIADGREPDWSCAKPDDPRTRAYRLLNDIAESFRQNDGSRQPDYREPIFTWRHLEVIEEIGSGAFGQVFRAYDPVLRRDVALKLAREEADRTIDSRAVIAEARSMARLRHSNILAVHGADEHEGKVGIWCDLLDGRTYADILGDRACLSPREVLSLAIPLADALVLIHRRGLVHGDIKPANIMIQPDGTPILMDFGAAREAFSGSALVGSPLVMAPEQFSARSQASQAGDIYAFGVLLYRSLSGRYPIEAATVDALVERHKRKEDPDYHEVPRAFRSLIQACLSREPGARPEAARILERLYELEQAPTVRRRRLAIGVVIASLSLGLLAAGIGWYEALQSQRAATLERNKAAGTLAFVENMLEAPSMLNKGPELKVVDLLDAAARELAALPDAKVFEAAPVHLILGRTYRSLDRYQAARDQLREALAKLEQQPGADTDEILKIRTELAVIAFFLDEPERSEELFAAVRTEAEAIGGRKSLPYLYASFKQGEIALAKGDYAGAIELLEHANTHASGLPQDEELPPKIQTKLAQLYAVSGRMDEAERLARDALQWELTHRGEATIPGVILRNSLAIVLNHKGAYAEAEAQLRAGLEALDQVAPGPSRIRSGLLANLANALHGQGRFDAAIEVNQQILETHRSREEPNWRRIIDVTGNIGGSYMEAGRYDQARSWLGKATALAAEKMGAESTSFLYPAVSLCSLYLETGAIERALSYCAPIAQTAQSVLGPSHLLTLQASGLHAGALARSGELDAGLAALDEVVASMRKQLGENNPSTLDIAFLRAEALLAAGRDAEARAAAEALLAGRRSALPAAHPDVAAAERLLAGANED